MPGNTVIWEQSGVVGRITLNRPETLNAWIPEFGAALKEVIEGPAADDSVRAVLLTGAGRGFSSGADLKAGFEPDDDGGPDVRSELHDVYHPAIAGIAAAAEARGGGRQRSRGRDRLLAGDRV